MAHSGQAAIPERTESGKHNKLLARKAEAVHHATINLHISSIFTICSQNLYYNRPSTFFLQKVWIMIC